MACILSMSLPAARPGEPRASWGCGWAEDSSEFKVKSLELCAPLFLTLNSQLLTRLKAQRPHRDCNRRQQQDAAEDQIWRGRANVAPARQRRPTPHWRGLDPLAAPVG